MADKRSNVDIYLRFKDNASGAFKRATQRVSAAAKTVAKGVAYITTAAVAATTALVALGAAGIVSITRTAATFENLGVRLRTLSTSAAEAETSLAWIKDFTATTPFQLEEVTDAFVKMKAYGLDPMDGTLRTVGDTAAAMGKTIEQAVEALADATMGEFERLKEFGVKARTEGDKVTFTWANKMGEMQETVAEKSPKIIQQTLAMIWNERYAGGMDSLSKTWDGMWSNLLDQISMWKSKVANSGPFQVLKAGLRSLLDELDRLGKDGTLTEWAKTTAAAIVESFSFAVKGVMLMAKTVNIVKGTVAEFQRSRREEGVRRMESITQNLSAEIIGAEKGFFESEQAFQKRRAELVESYSENTKLLANAKLEMEKYTAEVDVLAKEFAEIETRYSRILGLITKVGNAAQSGGASSAAAAPSGGTSATVFQSPSPVASLVAEETRLMNELEAERRKQALATTNFLISQYKQRTAAEAEETAQRKGEVINLALFRADMERQRKANEAIAAEERLAAEEAAREARLEGELGFWSALKERALEWAGTYEEIVATAAERTMQMFDQAINGIASAVSQAIVYQRSFAEAARGVLKSVAASVIQMLIELGLQSIISSFIRQKAVLAETQVAVAGAAAETFARAVASTVGSMGPYALAYAGGITSAMLAGSSASYAAGLALIQGLGSAQGSFHSGTSRVPREGSYVLKGNEMVADEDSGAGLREVISAFRRGELGGGGGGIIEVHTTVELNERALGKAVARAGRRGLLRDGREVIKTTRAA